MDRRLLLSAILLAALLLQAPAPAGAEKADMGPEALRRTATHVVTGTVAAVYERTSREGRWRYTRYVAEIRVAEVEKQPDMPAVAPTGECSATLAAGDLVYVRYWTRAWIGGTPPPSTNGHRGIPAEGARVRAYLARNAYDGFGETNDGGFNVIGANGFETLGAPAR